MHEHYPSNCSHIMAPNHILVYYIYNSVGYYIKKLYTIIIAVEGSYDSHPIGWPMKNIQEKLYILNYSYI